MIKYNPEIHKRRSIRLRDYDYTQAGAYFVTICSWKKECIFGDIFDGKIELNEYGRIVEKEWLQTKSVRKNIDLDVFVVMPNHLHGILIINNVGATRWVALDDGPMYNDATHQNNHAPEDSRDPQNNHAPKNSRDPQITTHRKIIRSSYVTTFLKIIRPT